MQVERFDLTDRTHEQWLALRHQDVTASSAGALMRVHPYQSLLGLYAEKIKPKPEPLADNGVLRRGRWMEAAAIKAARELRPKWQISEPKAYFRDTANRLGATPDAFFVNEDGECGVLQIKTAAPQVFKSDWHVEDDGGAIEVPFWIVIQSYIEARLSGFYHAAVGVLVVDTFNPEMHIIEFDCPESSYARLAKESQRFWRMIQDRTPPKPDFSMDLDVIKEMYTGSAPPVDMSGDESFGKLLAERDAVLARRNQAVEDAQAINAKLIHRMANAEAVAFRGRVVSYKEQARKGYTVEPSSFRVLRVGEAKGKKK